ncbi:hypothetical protein EAE99_001849 [Botrytis elliptica]|nr:hypothetical protein EAE99_001849 [Botrytis elliptica]
MKRSIYWLVLLPIYPALFLAAGCSAHSVSGKFTRPRTIIFYTNGALLILQQKASIAHVKWTDELEQYTSTELHSSY